MSLKIQRTWTADIDTNDGDTVTVGYPITIDIAVDRGFLQDMNKGVFRIYNLSEENRNQIFKDYIDIENSRNITVSAGYQNEAKVPIIFQGQIMSAYSYRSGVNWITEITAMDGLNGVQNGQVNISIPSDNFDIRNVFKQLINTMPLVSVGAIGNIVRDNTRGIVLSGNSWDLVNKIIGDEGTAFIDNGKANILKNDEYLQEDGFMTIINSDTGLLGTPRRFDTRVDVTILFEPNIVAGQQIELESAEEIYNGDYMVQQVSHHGIISAAVGGPMTTNLIFVRADAFTAVNVFALDEFPALATA